jgi:transposase
MRGEINPQDAMFSYVSPERRVPVDHPLRRIKADADQAVRAISGELDELYGSTGRPSIAPERLLKGQLLIALYSVRSDRAFCEQLDYNLLYRWFLDMSLDENGLDQSNFSRLRERLVGSDVARRFFEGVLRLARERQLLSSEHFTVDSTLIESWASLKSLKKKGGPPPKGGGDGTGMVDYKGEQRTNATHESTTDKEAKLMRRGWGQPAKLCFAGHALMDNRAGLCADLHITDARMAEPKGAEALIERQRRKRVKLRSLGADKGYCSRAFVGYLRKHRIRPHIARILRRYTPGLDARTTRHDSYRISQRKRKRIEEIFGWLKTVGGLRKTRFIGIERTQLYAYLAASAYNLLRMARMPPAVT